jgi:excisionase family DNA binding protein
MEQTTQRLFSIDEAAHLLGVSKTHMHALLKNDIPSFKLGRRRRIRAQDLHAFIDERFKQENPSYRV